MKITHTKEAEKLTVALEGRLDTITAPELETALTTLLEGVKELVLDMSALEYISSAGLRVVLKAQKVMFTQGAMTVVGANESILEVFEITGFADILNIQ